MKTRMENNYKYFIYAIREYFLNDKSRLDNRKFDSFKLLLDDYIKLENQISIEKNDKLENAKKDLTKNIIFYISNTLLAKSDVLGDDIKYLKKVMENNCSKEEINITKGVENTKKERKNTNRNVFYIISSLQKKIEKSNIIGIWIELLKRKAQHYDDVDIILDCLVSELIYMGYSTEFIYEWWKQNFDKDEIRNGNLEAQVEKFICLGQKKTKEYEVALCIQLPQKLKVEGGLKIHKLNFELYDEKRVDFKNAGTKDSILNTKVYAIDKYKAIEVVVSHIENYIKIYQPIDNSINDKFLKSCIVYDDGEKIEKEMHNRKSNIRELSNREKEDIADFIELRNSNGLRGIENPNMVDIENVINIIQKLPEFTKENRMLNLWSSIENLVRFYDKKTIIAKVTDIIPKIVAMYILKQKMNLLWDRMLPIMKQNKDLESCKFEDKENKYDREKFLKLLIDEKKSVKLFEQVKENILMQRSLLELHELLKTSGKLKNLVKLTSDSVIHNLNSIYRVRNDLVHNGGTMSSTMENQTRHLQKYLNHLLGTLIYYMKRNEEVCIPEILYSIDSTYNQFISNIVEIDKVMEDMGALLKKKEDEIKNAENDEAKRNAEEELNKLNIEYENKLMKENLKNIVFPQYLYLM